VTAGFPAAARLAAAMTVAAVLLAGCVGAHGQASAAKRRHPSPSGSTQASGVAPAGGVASARATAITVPLAARYGRVIARRIPSSGGFVARVAYLYVPRNLQPLANHQVPVLELLHGTPGQPSDWLTHGRMLATMERFAAKHGGRAPIVVMPDINGARRADSECIRTATGQDVERYLTQDVVAYVRHRYAGAVGQAKWWIAGLSEGGLCAAMLALRHPQTYRAFGDLSGLLVPTVEHVTPAVSDQQLYGGDATARTEHEPLWLLQHRRYPAMAGWFVCGAADVRVRQAQTALVAAAQAVRIPVSAQLRPGTHIWKIWGPALGRLLPWLWAHAAV